MIGAVTINYCQLPSLWKAMGMGKQLPDALTPHHFPMAFSPALDICVIT